MSEETKIKRSAGNTESKFCEVLPGSDYTQEELDFLKAIDEYKRKNNRPFPTWREVLRVFLGLGYQRVAAPGPLPLYNPQSQKAE